MAEEIGFRDELMRFVHAEPFRAITITMTSGSQYIVENPGEIAVGESVISFEPRNGGHSFFRLQQISNIDVASED